MGRRPRNKPDLIEEAEFRRKDGYNGTSPKTVDIDGVPHIQGHINEDLYAIPVKKNTPSPQADTPDKDCLPPGWEKHEDNDGPYYWHIKSGTIQREPPKEGSCDESGRALLEAVENLNPPVTMSSVPRSTTSSALDAIQRKDDLAFKYLNLHFNSY